ncbi:electron transporter SenC [Achromobacter sp. Root83]|nr:electron transporter SenC [Achromobacter sp. Root83]
MVEAAVNVARGGRLFIWLLLLAAGVALSAWQWHEAAESPAHHGGHTHLHDDSGKPARLYAWDASRAAQVTLATPADAVSLTRGPQGWDASPRGRAAGFDTADFLALLSQARSDRVLAPQAGETYGLNPPQLRIEVRDADGARLARIDVGALAPDGLGRYVQLPDEAQIRIIPDYQTRAPLAAMHQENP